MTKIIKLDTLNLYDFGNTIQMSGVIFTNYDNTYLCYLPNEFKQDRETIRISMDSEDWMKVITQTDFLEIFVEGKDENGKLTKILVRKSNRQISQGVSWQVFHRDGFRCRYCNEIGIPMTVDHLVLWEKGGSSVPENLLTACRKCNKARGNTEYEAWLDGRIYADRSVNLPPEIKEANRALILTLKDVPLQTVRKR